MMPRLLLALLLFFQVGWSAADDQVAFTIPTCQPHPYLEPILSKQGEILTHTIGGFYCLGSDFSDNPIGDSPLVQALSKRLSDQSVREIMISAFYFTSPDFARWLCALDYAPDASITVYHQQAGNDAYLPQDFAQAMADCPVVARYLAVGCDLFPRDENSPDSLTDNSCGGGRVNILHTKLLWMHLSNDQVLVAAGSGNFSKSLYANVEDWVVFVRPLGSLLERQVNCVFRTLYDVAGVPEIAQSFAAGRYTQCLSTWGAAGADEAIRFSMLPSRAPAHKERLINSILDADVITVAAQLLEDQEIIEPLRKSGGHIRIILDDDYYWTLTKAEDVGVVAYQDALAVKQLLEMDHVSVRYVLTNHRGDGEFKNALHTRLITTTKGGKTTIFTGSPHLKGGSFRLNFEQVLEISGDALTAQYGAYLDELWQRALPAEQMPVREMPITSS